MAPLALVGPATSGFSTASIIQSSISTGANYVVKQSTGRSITEHVMDVIELDTIKQSFSPNVKISTTVIVQKQHLPKSK